MPVCAGQDQALRLISELEDSRLESFKRQIQTLESQLEVYEQRPDPTRSLQEFAITRTRKDLLRALMAQPYFESVPESLVASLAEGIPDSDSNSGKSILKTLPLKRAARRGLLSSDRWVVHLCSGPEKSGDPISAWCDEGGMAFLKVDLRERGGKGWDLLRTDGVWKVLLWAASSWKDSCVTFLTTDCGEEGVEPIAFARPCFFGHLRQCLEAEASRMLQRLRVFRRRCVRAFDAGLG